MGEVHRGTLLLVLTLFVAVAPLPAAAAPPAASTFQAPLSSWEPHCLGFGSEWRYCDGTAIRKCPGGAVWRHTGVDIATGLQPVAAAADGEIAGYIVDPTFRGGVLIRHHVPSMGTVITQYWHIWPRPGFASGTHVARGQVFADVADMGARTHLHFAVFIGEIDANAWRGALPPSPCDGAPAFPYRFVDPNRFLLDHGAASPWPVGPALALHACWRCW
jgi:murein DD-endopeptidase MepM/ murein hydrolase activator NlpD